METPAPNARRGSRSPSPDHLMVSGGAQQYFDPSANVQFYNKQQSTMQNTNSEFMPSINEKQRALYTDPHANSNGFLMNQRQNDPLNFKAANQPSPLRPSTNQKSPIRTDFNNPDPNMIQQLGGIEDTVGSMRRSLARYEMQSTSARNMGGQRSMTPPRNTFTAPAGVHPTIEDTTSQLSAMQLGPNPNLQQQ